MLSLIVKKATLKSSGIQGNSITRKLVVLLHVNSPCYSFSMENSNTSYVWMVLKKNSHHTKSLCNSALLVVICIHEPFQAFLSVIMTVGIATEHR